MPYVVTHRQLPNCGPVCFAVNDPRTGWGWSLLPRDATRFETAEGAQAAILQHYPDIAENLDVTEVK